MLCHRKTRLRARRRTAWLPAMDPVDQFSEVAPRIVLPGATKEALKQMPEFKYAK